MKTAMSGQIGTFMKRHRRIIAVLFLILLFTSIFMISQQGTNYRGNNSVEIREGGYNLTVTPETVFVPPFTGVQQIQIFGAVPTASAGNITITIMAQGYTYPAEATVLTHAGFMRAYISLNSTILDSGSALVYISDGSSYKFHADLQFVSSALPLEIDLLIFMTGMLYILLVFSWDFRGRWIFAAAIPAYLLLSALMGQRYDTFFMITTGIRLVDGVSPFIHSSAFPASLKWEYPPLYLPYSVLSYLAAGVLKFPAVSNTSLNYPGTLAGFTYMAWRAFSGKFLPWYYLLIKLPMILATIGVYVILSKREGASKPEIIRFWILNPLVLLVGVIWGQIDVLAVFFLTYSVISLRRGRTGLSSLMCSFGTGFKIFPALLLPAILMKSRNRIRDVALFAAGLLPNFAVYEIAGSLFPPLYTLIYARSVPTFYGVFTSNGISWQYLLKLYGVSSFPSLFLYVFLPFYVIFTAVFLAGKWKMNSSLYITAVIVAFFLTYNYTNPQYFIWILPLLILEKDFLNAAVMSAIPVAYMVISYSFTYMLNPYFSFNYFSSMLGQAEAMRMSLLSGLIAPFILLSDFYLLYFLIRTVRKLGRRKEAQPCPD